MKHVFTILSIFAILLAFTACEKCATCTSPTDDPADTVDVISSDFCGRGREYSDQLTIYERRNWDCVED